MLVWSFQITLISIILIFLVHYLFNFFKSTLTVPKIKDLVNSPIEKYKNMYSIIDNKNELPITNTNIDINIKPPKEEDNFSMKNELKNFLKKQLNATEVSTFDSMSNVNSYLQL
jgi:hypothetical protein